MEFGETKVGLESRFVRNTSGKLLGMQFITLPSQISYFTKSTALIVCNRGQLEH